MKVSVCIPTFRRPEMLEICINSILKQNLIEETYEIIVVDNDPQMSARLCVNQIRKKSGNVRYITESQPNISIARNRAVEEASGELLAFIDDDEFPDRDWLTNLVFEIEKTNTDGVLGPVLPVFLGNPPNWITASGLYDRKRFKTGSKLVDSRYMRTGNVLFKKEILLSRNPAFDPELGTTGGEDVDFFNYALNRGHNFIWCDNAIVHEQIPEDRQNKKYQINRACFRGTVAAKYSHLISSDSLKSIIALLVYLPMLPVLRIIGMPVYMKYLIKCYDHWAKLLARMGIILIKGVRS